MKASYSFSPVTQQDSWVRLAYRYCYALACLSLSLFPTSLYLFHGLYGQNKASSPLYHIDLTMFCRQPLQCFVQTCNKGSMWASGNKSTLIHIPSFYSFLVWFVLCFQHQASLRNKACTRAVQMLQKALNTCLLLNNSFLKFNERLILEFIH